MILYFFYFEYNKIQNQKKYIIFILIYLTIIRIIFQLSLNLSIINLKFIVSNHISCFYILTANQNYVYIKNNHIPLINLHYRDCQSFCKDFQSILIPSDMINNYHLKLFRRMLLLNFCYVTFII